MDTNLFSMAGIGLADVPKIRLRDYQLVLVNQAEDSLKNPESDRILLQLPTGAGKTVIACELIRREIDRGGQILFLAHRRELVSQCALKLASFGIDAGIIMAGRTPSLIADVQVASIQTLATRMSRGRIGPPPATLIIIDEGHHATAATYLKIVESYPKAKVVGLTATPCRSDGRGLGVAL